MNQPEMSRQVNLYLNQNDMDKIQGYLTARNFLFLEDTISEKPEPVFINQLWPYPQTADYLCFSDVNLDYLQIESADSSKFRISGISADLVNVELLGMSADEKHFRIRFYYCPYYFVNQEKMYKSLEFFRHVNRFFRWLRRQFKRVPQMPGFYYNPDFPPKEWF